MIGDQRSPQVELQLVGPLRDMIPDDHILVQVDSVLDLSWLRDEVRGYYCEERGHPSIDPESALRLMLAGFLLGIVHDRALMRMAQDSLAIRWFAGYSLADRLPDHSSLTRIRQRWGEELFRRVFEKTIALCKEADLVDGSIIHVDATLMRANASLDSFVRSHVDSVVEANGPEESQESEDEDDENGQADGCRASKEAGSSGGQAKKVSKTDPEARLARKSRGDRVQPAYKVHGAFDDKAGVVVSAHVTGGDVSEGGELLSQLDDAEEHVGRKIKTVVADAGYGHAQNYGELESRETQALIPSQPPSRHRGGMPISRFKHDMHNDVVRCPAGKKLMRCRTGDQGVSYKARVRDCERCCVQARCVPPKSKVRTVLMVWHRDALVRARRAQWRGEIRGDPLYGRRFWLAEGVFAWANGAFGLGRAVRRGRRNVAIQAYLAFAVLNLKRLVHKEASEGTTSPSIGRILALWGTITGFLVLWGRKGTGRAFPINDSAQTARCAA